MRLTCAALVQVDSLAAALHLRNAAGMIARDGWAEYVELKTGKLYYHNHFTSCTQWETPPSWRGPDKDAASTAQQHSQGRY